MVSMYWCILFLLTLVLFKGKSSIFLAEPALPSPGCSSWHHRPFTSVHGSDSPSSGSFVLPKEVLPYFAFMPLILDLIKSSLHLCSVLWVALCCLFCAASCKSHSLFSCFPLKLCLCFLYNAWLFCHQRKCRSRTYLSFPVLLFQCENSFPFPPLLHSRVLPSCFHSMGFALKPCQCVS